MPGSSTSYASEVTIESFDDVRDLGEAELRELLEHGRPEERVWAIWALALRSVDVGELGRREEPDAGVRRNLAVVLAGHGEYDLLVALARRDPAPEVRGAAMQLVTRLAIDGKLPAAFVVERATSDAPEVRIAVLGTLFAGAPPWLVEVGQKLLDDRDGDVRYEAFEALMRAAETGPALVWLEEAPEPEARLALMRWSARGRVGACAEALSGSSRRLRRLLVESVRIASWHDLAPAIGDEPGLIRALTRRNPATFQEIPLAVLILATLREPTDAWIQMIQGRLATLDAPGDIDLLGYRELCTRRLAELDAQLAATRDDAELAALEDLRAALEAALDAAARFTIH